MTRGLDTNLVPPYEEPESALKKNKEKDVEDTNPPKKSPFKDLKPVFGKKKSKKAGESSSKKREESKLENLEENPLPTDTEYEYEYES